MIVECVVYFAHEVREGLGFGAIFSILSSLGTTIEKGILFAGMSMQVDKHSDSPFCAFLLDHFLQKIYLWVMDLARLLPLAVEIDSGCREPVVSLADSINIDHGDDFKHKSVSEVLSERQVRSEFFEKTLSDQRRTSLSRVDSA